jgi:hypothetical protein
MVLYSQAPLKLNYEASNKHQPICNKKGRSYLFVAEGKELTQVPVPVSIYVNQSAKNALMMSCNATYCHFSNYTYQFPIFEIRN